jgi:hypothetical protein
LLFPFPPLLNVTNEARNRPSVFKFRFELALVNRSVLAVVEEECVRVVVRGDALLGPAPGLEVEAEACIETETAAADIVPCALVRD